MEYPALMKVGDKDAVELLQAVSVYELWASIQAEVYREDTRQTEAAPGIRSYTAFRSGQIL